MTPDTPLDIVVGCPEAQRDRAAQLYYEAFRQKLHPIFRDETRGRGVLRQALNLSHAVAALRGGELIGAAGFKDDGAHFVDIQPRHMTEAFGVVGGWVRLLALAILVRKPEPGILLMDGIVVHPDARGLGVGTKLLDAIVEVAQARGYRQVRLDVVDTNPRARQLYERRGFVAVETKSYPWLRHLLGFSASTTMLLTL